MPTRKRNRNNNSNYNYNNNNNELPPNAPLIPLNEINEYKKNIRNRKRREKGKLTGYFPRVSKRTRRNGAPGAPEKNKGPKAKRFELMEERD